MHLLVTDSFKKEKRAGSNLQTQCFGAMFG